MFNPTTENMVFRVYTKRNAKREQLMSKGLLPTVYMVKLEGDPGSAWRRVLEDWNRSVPTGMFTFQVPKVVKVKDQLVTLSAAHEAQLAQLDTPARSK